MARSTLLTETLLGLAVVPLILLAVYLHLPAFPMLLMVRSGKPRVGWADLTPEQQAQQLTMLF
jgi:hypothetical protein